MVAIPKDVPVRDEKYRLYIKGLPCIICGNPKTLAHHQNKRGHGGKSTKCSDLRCLPLCFWHHTGGGTLKHPGAVHNNVKLSGWSFWEKYNIDVEEVIERFNEEYNKERGIE